MRLVGIFFLRTVASCESTVRVILCQFAKSGNSMRSRIEYLHALPEIDSEPRGVTLSAEGSA